MKKILSFMACASIATAFATEAHAEKVTVKDGDTLWNLSQEYNISVNDLKKWNQLETDMIKPEDTLEVALEKKYKVIDGDSLWTIAIKNNITVDQLMEWNKLGSDQIHPGDELIISKGITNAIETANSASAPKEETEITKSSVETKEPSAVEHTTKELTVSATAYTASCEGCSGVTATGINLKENPNEKVISVDPSVIPLGTKVYVEGYGTAVAGDTGGAIKGNKIDVFVPSLQEAKNWGRKTITVKILN
ncbi:LysM peptidoglycan-binding domain-containing protein [Niallia sp. 03133]|uniref:LysM peptidoglycan-binding domain-containing protein n=1 Tax=Niallia sp. 03133 TaxID=3458060 RepID=UPI004043F0AC